MTDSSEQTPSRAARNTSAERPASSNRPHRTTFKYVPDPMTEEARRQIREDFARIERRAWLVVTVLVLFAMFLVFAPRARADIITELGMGAKLNGTTSLVLQPNCHSVRIVETRPTDEGRNGGLTSCGGDNPLFVGWPVAWERELGHGRYRVRAGWFHMSHWLDGGADRETHLDCACVTVTINWAKRK